MFGDPGVAYVYFIYGMYFCLNAVTEPQGIGAAVLIRALSPEAPPGFASTGFTAKQLNGPGRLCREFGIDLRMNGWDLSTSDLRVTRGTLVPDRRVVRGPRVGIKRAADLPLRYRVSPLA
jgi:DNA-3-methyladenine glycosylase